MKVKVSEASGKVLNWMVAKADGWSDEGLADIASGDTYPEHDFCGDWAQGGPIIDKERISIRAWDNTDAIHAYMPVTGSDWAEGSTALIAAMRCFVASRLGGEVEVPDELA